MGEVSSSKVGSSEHAKFKRRQYLVDLRLQLRYTAYLVAVAVGISGVLGVFLWRTSREVVAQSERALVESKKLSDVVRMNIRDDPGYADNPELSQAFGQATSEAESSMVAQQTALIRKQDRMFQALVGGLSLLVVALGIFGVYFTHKVAGPIYKMKLLLRQLQQGRLVLEGRLRKGDELQDFYEQFAAMVEALRDRQLGEIAEIESVLRALDSGGGSAEVRAQLLALRDRMHRVLER